MPGTPTGGCTPDRRGPCPQPLISGDSAVTAAGAGCAGAVGGVTLGGLVVAVGDDLVGAGLPAVLVVGGDAAEFPGLAGVGPGRVWSAHVGHDGHHSRFLVIGVVAVQHPLPRVGGVEVGLDGLHGCDHDGVLAGAGSRGGAELEGVAV